MKLATKITLFVPGTVNVNELNPGMQAKFTNIVQERFTEWFGGSTTIAAEGTYTAASGIVREPINMVSTFSNDTSKLPMVHALAADIAYEMGQECVAVEVNGQVEFVESIKAAAA